MREVIVDLPPHPLDLLAHRGGQVVVSRRFRPLGFLRQHGQRLTSSTAAMRSVAIMGLAIVRDVAELYGGSISLGAAPMRGLRARLELCT